MAGRSGTRTSIPTARKPLLSTERSDTLDRERIEKDIELLLRMLNEAGEPKSGRQLQRVRAIKALIEERWLMLENLHDPLFPGT